jgi:hypothetical protein
MGSATRLADNSMYVLAGGQQSEPPCLVCLYPMDIDPLLVDDGISLPVSLALVRELVIDIPVLVEESSLD